MPVLCLQLVALVACCRCVDTEREANSGGGVNACKVKKTESCEHMWDVKLSTHFMNVLKREEEQENLEANSINKWSNPERMSALSVHSSLSWINTDCHCRIHANKVS